MTRPLTIDRAITDTHLLGAALGDVEPWSRWIAVLKAAFALDLSDEERATFTSVAGNRSPPTERVRELWAVVGRRGGKSRMAAALAVYAACFVKHRLAAGEVGHVLVLAMSRDQARVVFEYIKGFLEASSVLRQEIDSATQSEIRLRNGVVIGTHANSFRSVRGRTLLAVIFDEISLWRDEVSATPDIEVYRAVLPALMTTNGMLIGISTPYRKIGLLHQKWRDNFGVDGDVLVVQGPSTAFNPQLQQNQIDAAIADDPEGARAEWEATFRSDLAAFLDDATIDRAIDHDRPLEGVIRHDGGHSQYLGFVDPSGGRHDAFTICVGHKEGSGEGARFVADVIRGCKPPFDPQEVVKEYCVLLKEFSLTSVTGDRYSAEWVTSSFGANGISYEASEKSKSDLYLEALPLFTRGLISIPDMPPLIRELRLLERQTHRGGRDTVDHPRRGSDDLANALCGCAALSAASGFVDHISAYAGDNASEPIRDWHAMRAQRLRDHLRRYGVSW